MSKKATKPKESNAPKPSKSAPRPAGATEVGPEGGAISFDDLDLNTVLREAQKQVFQSEEDALAFFFTRLVESHPGDPAEGAQMREFLEVLLETDPQLREDLLSTVSIKK